jgi:hypothetical protein
VTAGNSVQNGLNWCNLCKSLCHEVASKFFATSAPDRLHWILNSSFGVFHSVWKHLESFFYCRKLGAKRVELVQLIQKFVPESCIGIFLTNAPDPPHWTPNSCFVAFSRVWVHLGPFRYCMKLGAKRAELVQLVQNYVPRSRVRIFRSEHT